MSPRRVELGRALHKLGKRKEAWQELEAAVKLDVEDINAHLQKVASPPFAARSHNVSRLRRFFTKNCPRQACSTTLRLDVASQG